MIEIVDYDETWAVQFERLRRRLADAHGYTNAKSEFIERVLES